MRWQRRLPVLKDKWKEDNQERRGTVDVQERVQTLTRNLADPKYQHLHANIRAALKLYKDGQVPTFERPWNFVDGKLLTHGPVLEHVAGGRALYSEVCISPLKFIGTLWHASAIFQVRLIIILRSARITIHSIQKVFPDQRCRNQK